MKVTAVLISKWNGSQPQSGVEIQCIGKMEFDWFLTIDRIRILKFPDGRRIVAMPSVKNREGVYCDVVYPSNREARKELNELVLEAVDKAMATIGSGI